MGIFILLVLYFGIPIAVLFFGKWVYAAISILAGDKTMLDNCNLCEKDNPLIEPYNTPMNFNSSWRNKGEGNMF